MEFGEAAVDGEVAAVDVFHVDRAGAVFHQALELLFTGAEKVFGCFALAEVFLKAGLGFQQALGAEGDLRIDEFGAPEELAQKIDAAGK